MAEAVGILEVFGLATAFVAADAGCKAANVRLEVFDKNKPANADSLPVPLLVCIKFRGSVEDVTAAVEAGMAEASRRTGVVQHYVIPNPTEDTVKMLKISYLKKILEDHQGSKIVTVQYPHSYESKCIPISSLLINQKISGVPSSTR